MLELFFAIWVRPRKQKRNQKMKMKQKPNRSKAPAAALAARTTQDDNAPDKHKEKAKATPLGYQKHSLAVGNQPREPKAVTHGHSGNLGAVTGLGIQLGTSSLDAELSALAKNKLQWLNYP